MNATRTLSAAVLVALLCVADPVQARRRAVAHPINPEPDARAFTLALMNRVLDTYRDEDLTTLWTWMDDHPRATESSLYAVVPPVRAFAYVVKYENESADAELIAAALDQLEISLARYELWGRTWLSPSVVNFHVLVAHRIVQHDALPAEIRNRAAVLWQGVQLMSELEASAGLVWPLPTPADSSETGDSKAEEFAWRATHFAAAILANPGHVSSEPWERAMRQMGYDAITRPSDPPDPEGFKFTTVTEDFRLDNHFVEGNPYYAIATPHLLLMAELCYRVEGKTGPEELRHNVAELYAVYKTYCSQTPEGQFFWNRPTSPPGDPTMFPFGMGGEPQRDLALARARVASGTLWGSPPPPGPIRESDFFTTVQDHKVGLYYAVGLYLWYVPRPVLPDH